MMELESIKAGAYEFKYNPLSTDIYINEFGKEYEIEIYKFKHYQGTLEIDIDGKLMIVEDFGLSLKKLDIYIYEVN